MWLIDRIRAVGVHDHLLPRSVPLNAALSAFERRAPYREEQDRTLSITKEPYNLVLYCLGRYGTALPDYLRRENFNILAVAFNPDEVRRWRQAGFDAVYGDACGPEYICSIHVQGVKWIVCDLPKHDLGITHGDPRMAPMDALEIS